MVKPKERNGSKTRCRFLGSIMPDVFIFHSLPSRSFLRFPCGRDDQGHHPRLRSPEKSKRARKIKGPSERSEARNSRTKPRPWAATGPLRWTGTAKTRCGSPDWPVQKKKEKGGVWARVRSCMNRICGVVCVHMGELGEGGGRETGREGDFAARSLAGLRRHRQSEPLSMH